MRTQLEMGQSWKDVGETPVRLAQLSSAQRAPSAARSLSAPHSAEETPPLIAESHTEGGGHAYLRNDRLGEVKGWRAHSRHACPPSLIRDR